MLSKCQLFVGAKKPKKHMIWNKMENSKISYALVSIEKEGSPLEKVVIVEEEIDVIGNLEDLPRLVFIDIEWRPY